jgi:hypothetical protein
LRGEPIEKRKELLADLLGVIGIVDAPSFSYNMEQS